MPLNIHRQLQQAEPASSSDGTEPSPQSHQQGADVGRREKALAETSSAIMNRVAILTSSTLEPGVTIRQRSDLVALLGPTFTLASSLLFVYGHLLATTTLTSTAVATRLFAANSFLLLSATTSALRRALRRAWNSKNVTKLRKKFFMEFATTILGPGGNMLIVLVFWPGWTLILGLLLAVRLMKG
ncbi:hypothetical protein LX32DRAFT_694087 [Colletotrichum zoysiae]|uniref:Uncharacterized protein n=1 Tax=Colletotrichum zoysiae TaxID=1216348 RepID=A0AAD9LZH8_9PEZI|nr:hypothetical protein LX32DRAFT_694087 [Colletotrichum zoysiae]